VSATLQTALYLGAVLLLGAGVFHHLVGAALASGMTRSLQRGAWAGALLIAAASLGDLAWNTVQLLGRPDAAFFLEYTLYTNHGRTALLRLGLVGLALAVTLRPGRRRCWLLPLGAGVLTTFSVLSHGAAMHGAPALLADLAHLGAATLWGGAILYTALSPAWRGARADPALVGTMARVSRVGLGSVLLLSATGAYAARLHLASPDDLVGAPYGRALLVKLALVGVILGVAALNRWWLLPALQRGRTQPLGRALKLEALLLIAVFSATGVLTTRPLPHL
jgi:putative copper export protein